MVFSIRDESSKCAEFGSQSGQAIVEYILVLVVTVGLVLGGVYQLNTAFKTWANAYFGDYIACLLETGELPAISGAPGDSGVCNELFQPFSFSEGRPLLASTGSNTNSSSGSSDPGGARENRQTGSGGPGSYTRVSSRLGGISRGSRSGSDSRNQGGAGQKKDDANTGNTGVSNYGSGYRQGGRGSRQKLKYQLDNQFAFEQEREKNKRDRRMSNPRRPADEGSKRTQLRIKSKDLKKSVESDESGFTFAAFLRFLIIAAIIIALIMVVGGQVLQVGKSMD